MNVLKKAWSGGILGCVLLFFGWSGNLPAHPADQGRLSLWMEDGMLRMQVFCPLTSGNVNPAAMPPGGDSGNMPMSISMPSPPDLELKADGVPLTGKLVGTYEVQPGPGGDALRYEMDYRLKEEPHRLELLVAGARTTSFVAVYQFADGNRDERLLAGGDPVVFRLRADETAVEGTPVTDVPPPGKAFLFWDYLKHGIWHILTGYDHMLFMAALLLGAVSFWDLVKVVTAFTLAHTLTLTLSVLDIFRLNERYVEPVIAASIVFVAVQNIVSPSQSRGWTRYAVAFGFGLFHGLGFAGGLLDAMLGLGGLSIWTALLAFSIGVELGHQCVVVPLYVMRRMVCGAGADEPSPGSRARKIEVAGSGLIAVAGVYYLALSLGMH